MYLVLVLYALRKTSFSIKNLIDDSIALSAQKKRKVKSEKYNFKPKKFH